MFKHILIPIDSRRFSHQAAMTGLEFAKKLDAQITLVHVLQMPPVYPPQSEHETLEAVREHSKELLEPWSKIAARHGVNLKRNSPRRRMLKPKLFQPPEPAPRRPS
jgi:nucleotide-binding universal stress UspA family protein